MGWIILLFIAMFMLIAVVVAACFIYGFLMTVDIMRLINRTNLLKPPNEMKRGN